MTETEVKTVRLGCKDAEFPSRELQQLESCNHLLGDRAALLKELDEKGYLYVQGLHDREEVLSGRLAVLQHIMSGGEGKLDLQKHWEEGVLDLSYLFIRDFHDREEVIQARTHMLHVIQKLGKHKLDSSRPLEEGVLDVRCGRGCIPEFQTDGINVAVSDVFGPVALSLMGRNDVTHSEAVNKVLEGPRPYAFFSTLFGEPAKTFDYKWLRAVHRQAFTGAHVDNVYMSRGTRKLYTMWTPFGDCSPEIGCLAVCEGSNRLPGFKKLHETYSETDIEAINLNGTGWFTNDPWEITYKFGGQWKTTNYRAGDVLIFGMKTVHMSTANLTDLVRISCDTRWQPASEPADPRYVGELVDPSLKFGLCHTENDPKPPKAVTIEELKAKWGFM